MPEINPTVEPVAVSVATPIKKVTEKVTEVKSEVKPDTLIQALLKVQKELPTVAKSSDNPFFKTKYAGLHDILPVVMPILTANNLFLTQSPFSEDLRIGIKTTITHISGDKLESEFTVQLVKNDPQGAGSAITYCRRYGLVSMLAINCDKDDDANDASTPTVKKDSAPKVFTKVITDEI